MYGCQHQPDDYGKRENYELMYLVCLDDNNKEYKSRVLWDHKTACLYDPNQYVPYDAFLLYTDVIKKIDRIEGIQIGHVRTSGSHNEPIKLVGKDNGTIVMVTKITRDGLPYHEEPIKRY